MNTTISSRLNFNQLVFDLEFFAFEDFAICQYSYFRIIPAYKCKKCLEMGLETRDLGYFIILSESDKLARILVPEP